MSGAERIAVVGMACRFPGAPGIPQFWRNLREGVESIALLPGGGAGDAEPRPEGRPRRVPAAAALPDVDAFDHAFFGFTPREAATADPQLRVFLECAWEALDGAGCVPAAARGAVGVYAGATPSTYLWRNLADRCGPVLSEDTFAAWIANDYLASHAAYRLDLRGPAITVQTACSSSLVAVHLACQALLDGECDLALAGGVTVRVPQRTGYWHREGGILSPDGHCRAFDADAAGTVFGSGAGVVALRRLGDAREHGDPVHAVILGSAVNNDGAAKPGYAAPGADGQSRVVAEALAAAGVDARTVGYLEAHGTATGVGDVVEVAALAEAFRVHTHDRGFCALGSVKSNLGHLEAAAGVAGLIKTVLALRNRYIPPTLHVRTPNPRLGLDATAFRVAAAGAAWAAHGVPRRAGVSSFGIGGTNAHVVLEEAPRPRPVPDGARDGPLLLPLSAASPRALRAMARDLAAWLRTGGAGRDASLRDVCYTAALRRRHHAHRAAFAAAHAGELAEALERFAAGAAAPPVQGELGAPAAEYARGGAVHWAALHPRGGRCVELPPYPWQRTRHWTDPPPASASPPSGHPLLGRHLESSLHPGTHHWERAAGTETLPLLAEHRVRGRAVLPAGHAVAAAHACARQALGAAGCELRGVSFPRMLAVDEGEVRTLQLAAAPGAEPGTLRFTLSSRAAGGGWTAHAEGSVAPCPGIGGDQGRDGDEGPGAGQPPRELEADAHYAALAELGVAYGPRFRVVQRLRVAPSGAAGEVRLAAEEDGGGDALATGFDACLQLLAAAALGETGRAAYAPAGVERVRVDPLFPGSGALRCHAVLRPEPGRARRGDARLVDAEGRVLLEAEGIRFLPVDPAAGAARPDGLLHELCWRPLAPVAPGTLPPGDWLVLAGADGLGEALAERLRARGARCAVVVPGGGYGREGADRYRADPASPGDFRRLLEDAFPPGRRCAGMVHLWSRGAAGGEGATASGVEAAQAQGCGSLLHLAQAAARAGWPRTGVWVVTRGALAAAADDAPPDAVQAAAWGLARTLRCEQPQLFRCVCVDAPAAGPAAVDALLRELGADDGEDQVALRGDRRYAARLAPAAHHPAAAALPAPRADGSYLVTGGLGGLGMEVARWLAERGAGALVLAGRSAPGPAQRDALERIRAAGARVEAVRADVSRADQVAALLGRIDRELPPLRGVVHAAGVLHDALLEATTWDAFRAVLAPKATGAWNLHALTRGRPLDSFVLFSSVGGWVGAPGQGNHAAASAFLDALAEHRRRLGLPAQSVAWGPWARVGAAAGAGLAARGFPPLQPEEALAALERLPAGGPAAAGVFRFDLAEWGRFFPSAARAPYFGELRGERDAAGPEPSPPHAARPGRGAAVDELLRAEAARVLGVPPAEVDPRARLDEQGLDSLASLELRNRIEAGLGVALSAAALWTHPTLEGLAALLKDGGGGRAEGEAPGADAVRALPEADAEAQLLRELAALEDALAAKGAP